MAGLGELMQPGGAPGYEPAAGSWSDLVKDPIARSTLLGFGLQMMTGGWGNGTQQLAAGLGAGATSGAATSEAMRSQMEADDKSAEAAANHAADRQNRLDAAKIAADSRAEVANIRTQGALERAALTSAAKSPNEAKFLADAMNKYMSKEKENQLISRKSDQQIEAEASQYAQNQLAIIRASGKPVADPGAGVPSNSPKPAGVGMGGADGQTPAKGTPGNTTAQNSTLDQMLADPVHGAKLAEDLKTPEGRQRLMSAGTRGKQAVQEYMQRQGIKEPAAQPGAMGKLWNNLTKKPSDPWQE